MFVKSAVWICCIVSSFLVLNSYFYIWTSTNFVTQLHPSFIIVTYCNSSNSSIRWYSIVHRHMHKLHFIVTLLAGFFKQRQRRTVSGMFLICLLKNENIYSIILICLFFVYLLVQCLCRSGPFNWDSEMWISSGIFMSIVSLLALRPLFPCIRREKRPLLTGKCLVYFTVSKFATCMHMSHNTTCLPHKSLLRYCPQFLLERL